MIYITGDTHGDNSYIYNIQNQKKLTEEDYIIVCGDFGFVWNGDYKRALYKLRKCTKATILSVMGNHENYDLLENFPEEERFGGRVGKLYDRIYWLKNGIYEIEGHTFFCFGGARSIDQDWRIPGKSWWPQEEPTVEEMIHGMDIINENLDKIEYVITHDCPQYTLKFIDSYKKYSLPIEEGYKVRLYFDNYFERLYYDSKSFKHWYCGHHHTNKDFDDLKFSFLYHRIKEIEV